MRYKIRLREARDYFDRRRPFDCNGTLRGTPGSAAVTYGRLPRMWQNFHRQFEAFICYTVWSYQTPIAWVMRSGEVVVPPVRYSPTTSRHAQTLRLEFSPAPEVDEEAA